MRDTSSINEYVVSSARGNLIDDIRGAVVAVVKENVDETANLLARGLTSIDAIRILNSIEQKLGIRPSIDAFFRDPTIRGLERNLLLHLRQGGPSARSFLALTHAAPSAPLSEPCERESFKDKVRRRHEATVPVSLGQRSIPLERYLQRSSARQFGTAEIDAAVIEKMLKHVSAEMHSLNYLSGGFDLYVHVRPTRVAGLQYGLYRYDLRSQVLSPVMLGIDISSNLHFGYANNHLADQTAFTLFVVTDNGAFPEHFVCQKSAFAGQIGMMFCNAAVFAGIAICPLHGFLFERIGRLFTGYGEPVLLHLLVCGASETAGQHDSISARGMPVVSIPSVERVSFVSPGQERMLNTEYRLEGGTWPSDVTETDLRRTDTAVIKIEGPLDVSALKASLSELTQRHTSLRSFIRLHRDGMPRHITVSFIANDLVVEQQSRNYERDVIELERMFGCDLVSPEKIGLFSVRLLKWDERRYALIVSLHHLMSDGWSASVVLRELSELYRAFVLAEEPQLDPINYDFADHVADMSRRRNSGELERQRAFWASSLADQTVPLRSLQTSASQLRAVDDIAVHIPSELVAQLRSFSAGLRYAGGLSGPLLSGLAILLHEKYQKTQINVGLMVPARTSAKLEGLVGFIANRVVIRLNMVPTRSLSDFVSMTNETIAAAMENQDLPIQDVVQDMRNNGLLEAHQGPYEDAFALNDISREPMGLVGLKCSDVFHSNHVRRRGERLESSKVNMRWELDERHDGLRGIVEFSRDYYNRDDMEIIVSRFIEILSSLASQNGTLN